MTDSDDLKKYVKELHARLTVDQLAAFLHENYEIEQTLGRALGYPPAYPDVSDIDDGTVVVGPHTPLTLAQEAADRIRKLTKELEDVRTQKGAG